MKYRKKPVVIEAMQFTSKDKDRAHNWVRCNTAAKEDIDGNPILVIQTPEGDMTARLGDWIIKGVEGEFYPCMPGVFAATYDPVDEEY